METISSAQTVTQFLFQHVHKDLQVENVKFIQSLTAPSQAPRVAYILVTLGSKRQAHMVQKNLRKIWIGDSPVKAKIDSDANKEMYDNRTILIRGIPNHFNSRHILETFGGENGGAVVGIELPTENIKVAESLIEHNLSASDSPIEQQKRSSFKQAQQEVQQSLDLD